MEFRYRKWCTRNESGVSNNNGVAFRTPANISGDNYSELYSANASNSAYRPVMYVNYVSHAGIEGWWQYEQMGAGRAGTAYADLFNGNMVLEHADTSMTGNRNPVSVNHYYNSCRCGDNSYGSGYGWKTDAHQKITALTLNDTNYYVWEDGDGTEHFFEYTGGSGPFKDAEGMELELRIDTSAMQITITDKSDNVMTFKILQAGLAWLESTKDACGNTSTYAYVSGHEVEGRLDKITDPVGRVTQFAYNANGLIASIAIPAAEDNTLRTVYYTYDSSSRLTGVRYSELGGTAAHTTYTYDGLTNLLTRARNFDGVQVNVGYESTSLYGTSATDDARRVKSLETVATNSAGAVTMYGAKQIFEYGAMTTEVTAVEDSSSDAGKKLYYQFNDAGNVTCVRDDLGFAQFTKFDSGIENKPSQVSKLRKAVVNRLRKSDFNSQWTAVTAGGTAAKDADTSCLNCASMKLNKTGAGEVIYRQEVPLEAGTAFTLSAYVKTDSLTGGGAFLRIRPVTAGAFEAVSSDGLTGTTDAAVGNELPTDGWERIRVTLKALTAPAQAYVELVCDAAGGGTAWFACPQLETGEVMNAFNLVSNGDFRYTEVSGAQTLPLDWGQGAFNLNTAGTGVFAASTDATFPSALEGNYVQVEGRPDKTLMGFVQNFDMKGKAGDIFVVGGWADGRSIPNADSRDKGFTLALSLKKASDGEWINPAVYPFNGEWVGWQQSCYATAAGADYTQIALYILYTGNCNKAKFTNIFLHREAYGTTFGYDDDGNVLSISNLAGQHSKSTYDSEDNEQTYIQPGREDTAENQYWAYYGDSAAERKKHLPWRTRTPMNVTNYFEYDIYGNPINERRVDYKVYTEGDPENAYPFIRTENAYTSDGNFQATKKDSRGNTVVANINLRTGQLFSVTDAENYTLEKEYDASGHITTMRMENNGTTNEVSYAYENDRLVSTTHNNSANPSENVTFNFEYDALGRNKKVSVGNQELSSIVYHDKRGSMPSDIEYANGGKTSYEYDDFNRLVAIRFNSENEPRFTYSYAANGEVAEVRDHELNTIIRTEYDLADRPCGTETIELTSGSHAYKSKLKYDKLNNLEQIIETVQGEQHNTSFEYDRDNRVTKQIFDGNNEVEYVYDELGRLAKRLINGTNVREYGYVAGGYGTNSTTPVMDSITQNGISFGYTYDARGNIVSETQDSTTVTYEYDAMNQLVRINNPHENATWVFNYNAGGNMTTKVRYAYTTEDLGAPIETVSCSYTDANWKDKLTSFNGRTIAYDLIGNPLADGVWTYAWESGRHLSSMSKDDISIQYKYNQNGLRISKLVETGAKTIRTNYILNGKRISAIDIVNEETNGTSSETKMYFFYDVQNMPIMLKYNNEFYSYVHNLQGDIIRILDSNNTSVVEYRYDAWGKLLSITGSMADSLGRDNPFRFRSYVWDDDAELYYLENRYYSPLYMRFLNPDVIVSNTHDIRSANAFLYCSNNPVKRIDVSGNLWNAIVGFCNKVKDVVVEAVDTVKEVVCDTFGFAVYSEVSKTTPGVKGFLFETERSETVTTLTSGDDDKPIVFSLKFTPDGISFGLSINIGKVSLSGQIGSDGVSVSAGYENTSLELGIGRNLDLNISHSTSRTSGKTTYTVSNTVKLKTIRIIIVLVVVSVVYYLSGGGYIIIPQTVGVPVPVYA